MELLYYRTANGSIKSNKWHRHFFYYITHLGMNVCYFSCQYLLCNILNNQILSEHIQLYLFAITQTDDAIFDCPSDAIFEVWSMNLNWTELKHINQIKMNCEKYLEVPYGRVTVGEYRLPDVQIIQARIISHDSTCTSVHRERISEKTIVIRHSKLHSWNFVTKKKIERSNEYKCNNQQIKISLEQQQRQ